MRCQDQTKSIVTLVMKYVLNVVAVNTYLVNPNLALELFWEQNVLKSIPHRILFT